MKQNILLILVSFVLLSGCMSLGQAVDAEKEWEKKYPIWSNIKNASGTINPLGATVLSLLGIGGAMAFGTKKPEEGKKGKKS